MVKNMVIGKNGIKIKLIIIYEKIKKLKNILVISEKGYIFVISFNN
jgi:hypothetical protein